ncbi:DNA-methyltransferase [Caulobacter sp. DWR3-1-2]|uniref:DNA-methyltransferase n=1 Tax=Caulobacter sp. DWR3-1-2 TaxID=2804647 RepID=UPI003CE9469B
MITILHGDSRVVLQGLADESIDGCVSDAPYALVSINKRFGSPNAAPATSGGASGVYRRASAGFMGQGWDTGETAHDPAFWAEVWRVLKPGGHIIVAAGTRTYHRLAVAIEDAGFEIRDMLTWLYGTGFPKSHNHDIDGEKWGTGLKPACEPWVLARKPLIGSVAENIARYGVGALNIDRCRVGSGPRALMVRAETVTLANSMSGKPTGSTSSGAMTSLGRWPANVVHDGSAQVVAAFPQAGGQRGDLKATGRAKPSKHAYGDMAPPAPHTARGDSGSAARFFYCAKATKADRCGSKHPTVKPIKLMQWFCRMIIPPGGVVLDPFAGSGTTGAAAYRDGFSAILIEREARFVLDIERRMAIEQQPKRVAA